jgi:predicted O-methyltransferase YrrM
MMNKVYLSEAMLSEVFWPRLRNAATALPEATEITETILSASRIVHKRFPPETAGSIDKDAIQKLWLLARYFRPRVIAEVGTFIGRSTLALSEGAGDSLQQMHTCDYSFAEFGIPEEFNKCFKNAKKIAYHAKTASNQMFKSMLGQHRESVDCFFLDGRLSAEDIEPIKMLRSNNAVFIIDDFEGVEKGVANVMLLRQAFKDLLLLRPEVLFEPSTGLRVTNTALMLTANSLSLSRQQEVPLDMC